MQNTDKILEDIHARLLERKILYKSHGYDIDEERAFIIEKARPLNGEILEAGTGKGYFTLALARLGYPLITFDISEEEQRYARFNINYAGLDHLVDFRIENGEQLSFKDKIFNLVFSVNTIHHLVNPYQVVDELIRVLDPKGKLILSDFNKEGFNLMDEIHAAEGRVHEIGDVTFPEIIDYLHDKGFSLRQYQTRFHETAVTCRTTV
jgi:2-polyprenyl-3-methyl-5-hydroxy-6-metoxy-1,4-benzoquinol methylase